MKVIRRGVFETNSSSTHSITMCTEDEFDDYLSGKTVMVKWRGYHKDRINGRKFVPTDEAINMITEEYPGIIIDDNNRSHILRDNGFLSSSYESDYLEYYEEHYTTPSGEKIVAFGEYGRDG